jgi:hypothetical protein
MKIHIRQIFPALILKCYHVHEYLCTDVKLGFSPPKEKEKQQVRTNFLENIKTKDKKNKGRIEQIIRK